MRRMRCGFLALVLLCSCTPRADVVVGCKNFTEQYLLAEIAAQQLERKLHVSVRRKFGLGGTLLTQQAIENGGIDLYPEYTGTAATVVLKIKTPGDPEQTYRAVQAAYRSRFHLIWLQPLGFNDTFAMVVRRADAVMLASPTLSSAARRTWRLGIGYEFLTRPDGLQRLDAAYDMRWQGNPKSMDLGLLYQALQENSVDMAAGNSTDAQLSEPTFSVLADDRHAFPPYQACYVVREALLLEKPDVARGLNELQNRISEAMMRAMNRRVQLEHQSVEAVARDFLARQP
ncbi:MAG: ABC transporter substrate-binding protein [Acidobacteriaceae bacterium]|nr:ABC transporter substrate-binding protein [Acidobacteriaceae bacterium]